MFRGFEIILRGKDPQAGLIMTPRICGICGGSHLYKACYALDTAWGTYVPPNATRVRNLGQITETLQSMPRYFYAIMGPDLTAAQYAGASTYEEAARRFAPYVGTSYQTGVTLSQLPVEIYAIFGGQWPHSSFMIPGGVMCAPTLSDVTRSTAILDHWGREWLEGQWLGCSVDRYLRDQDVGGLPRLDGRERVAAQQRPRLLLPALDGDRPRQVRPGLRQLPRHGHVPEPGALPEPHGRGPQRRPAVALGHLRQRPVLRLRPDAGQRGHHPLVLPRHRLAAPVGGRDRPDRPGGRCRPGQVHLGQGAALRRARPGLRPARGRSARPPDDGQPARRRRAPGLRPVRRRHDRQGRPERPDPRAGPHARGAEVLPQRPAVDQGHRPARGLLRQAGRAAVGQGLRRRPRPPAARCRTGSSSRTARSPTTR